MFTSSSSVQSALYRAVDEFYLLLAESAEFQTHGEVRRILEIAARTLQSIRTRLQRSRKRYVVAVVGLTNVGKSTLLNALLGEDLAPRRNGPCTSAPVEFLFGPTLSLTVHYRDRLERLVTKPASLEELHAALTRLADEGQPQRGSTVNRVAIELPCPLLAGDLVIADTPGFGAAQLGDSAGAHELAVKEYLQKEVSQVFWVVLADQGIGQREISFHNEWFSQICDDLLVTGSEDWSQEDRVRYRRRFSSRFSERAPRFHFVSGLQGVQARQSQDTQQLEAAGIPLLQQRIRELSSLEGRRAELQLRLDQLAEDVRSWLSEFEDERGRRLTVWWRPDSWDRFRDAARTDSLTRSIAAKLTPR
jgi:GTP-binding protein EngB required for normal cell division